MPQLARSAAFLCYPQLSTNAAAPAFEALQTNNKSNLPCAHFAAAKGQRSLCAARPHRRPARMEPGAAGRSGRRCGVGRRGCRSGTAVQRPWHSGCCFGCRGSCGNSAQAVKWHGWATAPIVLRWRQQRQRGNRHATSSACRGRIRPAMLPSSVLSYPIQRRPQSAGQPHLSVLRALLKGHSCLPSGASFQGCAYI